jgi:hypothetical protein
MKGDAAFLLAPETADGRDPAAVPHRRHHELVEESAVHHGVSPLRDRVADPLGELRTSSHHDVGSQVLHELLIAG